MGVRRLAVDNGPNIFQMLLVEKSKIADSLHFEQDGLAVASIARDVVVEMTSPAYTMRSKVGSEFET